MHIPETPSTPKYVKPGPIVKPLLLTKYYTNNMPSEVRENKHLPKMLNFGRSKPRIKGVGLGP